MKYWKHLTIRMKITLWFTAALILVMALTYFITFSVSNRVIQKTIRDNLIETVGNNVDEIEFYPSLEEIQSSSDVDHFLEYGDGYLEVDDDFLDAVNEVYTTLYRIDGAFLYGENPIAGETQEYPFIDSQIQQIKVGRTRYYIFDRKLTAEGLGGLWLRGVVSEEQDLAKLSSIVRLSLILMPLLVVAASLGGYLIARRVLRPIQRISYTAQQIGKEQDLTRRIQLDGGKDELHELAESFNDMFDRLEQAFEMERQFISDASHELRTPASVIGVQCELTLEKTRSPEEYEEALRVIQRQNRRMSRLISDMLDFTRLEVSPNRYQKEKLDLSELVQSVCEDMAMIQEKNITLEYEAGSGNGANGAEGIAIKGSTQLISRLVANLISNAYRYGRENGHIWVNLQQQEGAAVLTVRDDGIGIAKEEQNKIFRRFYQVDPARGGNGIGLGLSMAQEIARFHGGRITVESTLGKGSTFQIIFPL